MKTKLFKIILPAVILYGLFIEVSRAQDLEVADVLAAMSQHASERPLLQFDVLLEHSIPDAVLHAEDTLKSFEVAMKIGDGLDETMTPGLRTQLQAQLEDWKGVAPTSILARVRESADRTLVLGLMRTADGFPEDEAELDKLMPSSFDPSQWNTQFKDRLRLGIWRKGSANVEYVHDDALGNYQWVVTHPESKDEIFVASSFANFTNRYAGFPFSVNTNDRKLFELGLLSMVEGNGSVSRDVGTGNWIVSIDGQEAKMDFIRPSKCTVTKRLRTQISISPSCGYLPTTVEQTYEFFSDGIPIECQEDWKQMGRFWEVEIGGIEGHFYPKEITYKQRWVSSPSNSVIAAWWKPEEYLAALRSPFPADARLVCVEKCSTRVLNVILEKDAAPLPNAIEPPPQAAIIDRVKNTLRIPSSARQKLRVALDRLPKGVELPGEIPSNPVGKRFLVCAALVGIFASIIYRNAKKKRHTHGV